MARHPADRGVERFEPEVVVSVVLACTERSVLARPTDRDVAEVVDGRDWARRNLAPLLDEVATRMPLDENPVM